MENDNKRVSKESNELNVDKSCEELLIDLFTKLHNESKPLDEKFAKILNDNFLDLLL